MDVGPAELIIVLLIVLLIFGGSKLPQLARSMGQASKEFKKGLSDGAGDDTSGTSATGTTNAASATSESATGDKDQPPS